MRSLHISGHRIAGVACAVPRQVVKNDGPTARAGKAVGVLERRHVGEQSLLELAHVAAKECMKSVNWHAGGVSALVFITQSQPRRIPSVACELHNTLGLADDTPAFDVGLACSGYVYGIWLAMSLRLPRVLLVVGDTISRFLDPNDMATYPIFGDAVSCTAIEQTSQWGTAYFTLGTEGDGAGSLYCEQFLRMDGRDVFDFALRKVPELVAATTMNGYVDYVLFHQANRQMVEHIAKKSRLEMERVPFNLERFGNTSSASIPLLMCASSVTDALRSRKCRLAMLGFGGGFSYGGALLDTDSIPCSLVEV